MCFLGKKGAKEKFRLCFGCYFPADGCMENALGVPSAASATRFSRPKESRLRERGAAKFDKLNAILNSKPMSNFWRSPLPSNNMAMQSASL